jgi:hypothetical protein
LLSSSGCSNVEQISICHDFPLCCVQTKRCGNLDGLAGCGIIGTHVRFTLEIDQLQLIGLIFYRASHPDESSLEKKTGAAMGNSQDNARF